MPKLKTKKGVAKRFKLSKKKKVRYYPGGKSHLATGKAAKRIRRLGRRAALEASKGRKFIKKMLPYG
jgi:large subunit ribosomal protein L35